VKKTTEYLEESKKLLGISSDYALAKWLEVTDGAMSHYKTGRRTIDDYTAARIADALGINPMEIIAAANAERAEREKDEKRREYWRKVFASCAAACLLLAAGMLKDQGIAEAKSADNFHYAQLRGRLRRRSGRGEWHCGASRKRYGVT